MKDWIKIALLSLRKSGFAKRSIAGLSVFVLCSHYCFADATKSFSDVLLSLETMVGEFEQKIVDGDGNELQNTQGQFKVKRPGYFWWHVSPPYEQVVVGTPDSLKVYDPDLEQMTVHSQDSYTGSPAWLISGDVAKISEQYDVSKRENEKTITFVLKQKQDQESAFESLSFDFINGKKNKALHEMTFIDKLGQKTQISVSKLKLNKKLAEDKFLFEPPKGTDIIVDG